MDLYVSNTMYHVLCLLLLSLVIGVSIASAIYFTDYSSGHTVYKLNAITMVVMNVVIAVLSTIILIWASYILITSEEGKYSTMHNHLVHHQQMHH